MEHERDITTEALADLIVGKLGENRLLVGLAGPPGAGKSTSAGRLNDVLNASGKCRSAVFQMDGYHYDDGILNARGLRPRKGAPNTFDVAGFRHMLARLKRNEEAEIAVPVFDRDLEISRAGARIIRQDVNVLIVEGNYLLLDSEPWSSLAPLFDVSVNIRVSVDILRQRLMARWEGYGLSAEEVASKVEANDLPNGMLVVAESRTADFALRN